MKMTFKIWVLIFFLVASLVAINPLGYFDKGAMIKTVEPNSPASLDGLANGQIIREINGVKINSIEDYRVVTGDLFKDISPLNWTIKTSQGTFSYNSFVLGFDVDENLTSYMVSEATARSGLKDNYTIFSINDKPIEKQSDFYVIKKDSEPKVRLTITTNKGTHSFFTQSLGITAAPIPKTNLKAGLDLSGGARALVKPEVQLTASEMEDLISVTKERLNVFGLSDIVVRSASDLAGNSFMVVEVAGSSPRELEELIGSQGKFEAKIGNDTVFVGGKNDITSVCKTDPSCSGVRECAPSASGYYCRFEFVIYLSGDAAQRQADITSTLTENITASGDRVLSKNLELFLDDKLVDSLQISSNLKGKASTQIAISGPGNGATQTEAYDDATRNMAKLQTVMVTGSLPYKLEIVKLDSISPLLGDDFIKNIFYASLVAFLAVALIIFARYRNVKLVLPVMITLFSEVFITLGIAAIIRWNLDISSIAGIIATIGTGVTDQVILLDESEKKGSDSSSLRERVKKAFFVIIGSFAVTAVAMVPLWWAGAGLLRGFALTTLIGISIGVLITRPAFSSFIGQLKEYSD